MSSPTPPGGGCADRTPNGERFGLLISIQPWFAHAILDGTKTVELRRRPPRDQPDVVIIYGSGTAKAVLGVAKLEEVHTSTPDDIWEEFGATAGVTRAEFDKYFEGSHTASALELSHPRRSGTAVSLSRLREFGLEPPQSWRYVDLQLARQLLGALGISAVEPGIGVYRSHSRPRRTPTVIADLGLIEATARLNRPLLRIVRTVRCFGSGAVGRREAATHSRLQTVPPPDLG